MAHLLPVGLAFAIVFPLYAWAAEDFTDRYLSLPGSYSFVRLAPEGEEAHKVRMLVFEDFLCPVCYELATKIPTLQEKYQERLEVTFIGYPFVARESVIPVQAYALAREMGIEEKMQQRSFTPNLRSS